MAGNKNSGRKSGLTNLDVQVRLSVLARAWKLIADNIDNPELDLEYRLELATKLCVKSIPTEVSGGLTHEVKEMPAIRKELLGEADGTPINRILEFNIGSPHTPADT